MDGIHDLLYRIRNMKQSAWHFPLRGFLMRALLRCTPLFVATALVSLTGVQLAAQSVMTRVDSARHEVIIETGPFNIPAIDRDMAMEMDMGHMAMHHDQEVRVFRFDWPVDGYGRGFRVEVRDSAGAELPRSLLHHLIAINFDRRQFIYSAVERLFGVGKETPAVSLPGTLAVPLDPGQRLGFYVAWHNDTGRDIKGASVRLIIDWIPRKVARSYTAVLPVYIDVDNEIGGTNTFDIPPGRSTKTFEFKAPVDGQLYAVSGHLHDYGSAVRLEDAESGKILVRLSGERDDAGKILGVSQKIYFFRPLRLREGHRYRVVAEYDSPLKETLADGAMASIVGVFAPEQPAKWPAIDPDDPTFQKDIESLRIFVPTPEGSGAKAPRTELMTYLPHPRQ
jgi:hypothetical protein